MLVYTHFIITRPFRILPRRTSEITRTYYNISSVSIIFDREILPFETNTKNYCQSFHPDPCFHPPPLLLRCFRLVFVLLLDTRDICQNSRESQRDRDRKRATIRSKTTFVHSSFFWIIYQNSSSHHFTTHVKFLLQFSRRIVAPATNTRNSRPDHARPVFTVWIIFARSSLRNSIRKWTRCHPGCHSTILMTDTVVPFL